MANIFLAHSRHDEEIKNLFLRAIAGAVVHPVLKEYEDVAPSVVNPGSLEGISLCKSMRTS